MATTRAPLSQRVTVNVALSDTSEDGSPNDAASMYRAVLAKYRAVLEVDDFLGRSLSRVKIIGVRTRREVLPSAIADDEDDHTRFD